MWVGRSMEVWIQNLKRNINITVQSMIYFIGLVVMAHPIRKCGQKDPKHCSGSYVITDMVGVLTGILALLFGD